MSLGKRIGYSFYGIAVVMILLGIMAVPSLHRFIDQAWGSIALLHPILEGIKDHIWVYVLSLTISILIFLMDQVIGLNAWTLEDVANDFRFMPRYLKWPLFFLLGCAVILNLDWVVQTLMGSFAFLKGLDHFYFEWFGHWTQDFSSGLMLLRMNLFMISFTGIVALIARLSQAQWKKEFHKPKRRIHGTVTQRLSTQELKKLSKAERLLEKGKPLAAAREYERLGDEFSYRAAKIYAEHDLHDKANQAFYCAAEFFFKRGTYLRAGDAYFSGRVWDKAVASYSRVSIVIFGEDRERILEWATQYGEAHYNLEQYDKAAEIFTKYGLHRKAAQAYEKGGMHTKAADAYDSVGDHESSVKVLTEGGYQDLALFEKGKWFLQEGKFLEAAEAFEEGSHFKSAANAFSQAGHHSKAAKMFVALGEEQKAVELFLAAGDDEQALASYVRMADFKNAALLAGQLGLRLKQAEFFEKAKMFVPAARAYLTVGNTPAAVEALRKVIFASEHQVNECEQVLKILLEQNRLRDGMACAYALLEGRHKTALLAPLIFCVGQLHQQMGNMEKAFKFIHKAAVLQPIEPKYASGVMELSRILGRKFEPPPVSAPDDASTRGASVSRNPEVAKTATQNQKAKPMNPLIDTEQDQDTTATLDDQTVFDLTDRGSLSRYQVIKELGRGGMGYVYKAKDKKLKRFVALKMLHPQHNKEPRVVMFFKREAMSVASLNHPNLVHLFDMGKEKGCFYMIMEYVEGHTLKDLIERYPDFMRRNLLPIWHQACQGLKYAHEHGILHRDLKPSNLMWTKDRRLKVLDFGLAKAVTDLDQTKQLWGTPCFMAPELFNGERATFQTDIYGLGATFYMLATHRAPFGTEDSTNKFTGSGLPIEPHQVNPRISKELSHLILKCMYLDPAERFQTMDELMREIRQVNKKKNAS